MKKSQILATLALAFALGLGVVAPAASTYATVRYPQGTTEAQKEALNNDVNTANSAYGELYKISQYTDLYNSIEGNGALRDQVEIAVEQMLGYYNNNVPAADDGAAYGMEYINSLINQIRALQGYDSDQLYYKVNDKYENLDPSKTDVTKMQAELKTMSKLSRATSLKNAYEAVDSLNYLAQQNLDILDDNYDSTKTPVSQAIAILQDIVNRTHSFMVTLGQTFDLADPADYANKINAIDEAAYKNLINSQAWVDAADNTYGVKAIRYGLFMNAAANLPKYNYVEAVIDAKTNFDKIRSNQSVDYNVALDYLSAFNTAIKNYRDGKAPVTPETPDTKPGDEGKDPTAPDTGILADAEGNASTTVAMVAGVATALTAAGAGVVAYRNARRSTRK